jgi:hypothetical protein
MCSLTVAVSGAWATTGAFWAPAVWIPPPHNGQRNAVPLSPAARNNPTFTDGNMFNLLPDESG